MLHGGIPIKETLPSNGRTWIRQVQVIYKAKNYSNLFLQPNWMVSASQTNQHRIAILLLSSLPSSGIHVFRRVALLDSFKVLLIHFWCLHLYTQFELLRACHRQTRNQHPPSCHRSVPHWHTEKRKSSESMIPEQPNGCRSEIRYFRDVFTECDPRWGDMTHITSNTAARFSLV